MKLTRRGYALLAVVVLAVGSASLFGARGLNAIAAPGLVAFAYAIVQVWRIDEPVVARDLPQHGEQGMTVPIELNVEVDRPYSARLLDTVGDGLEAAGNVCDATLGAGPVRYELFLRRRGDRRVGPATVEAQDVLGLVTRRFEVRGTASILVRPAVYPLSGPRADELVSVFGGGSDRQEFDFLRHYRRGDPLRDVHWRSSAKVPGHDFVVKEFSTGEGERSVRLAGESSGGHADKMAAATASIAVHFLAAGLRVGLATSDTRIPPQGGTEQRDRVLDALALTRGGGLQDADRRDADVLVTADPYGVKVAVADATAPFSQVAGREVSLPARKAAGSEGSERPGGLA